METAAAKDALRRKMRALRMNAEAAAFAAAEREIRAAIAADPHFASARTVAAYLATEREISVDGAIDDALARGCRVAVPRWDGSRYVLALLEEDWRGALASGPMGIREPGPDAMAVDPREIDAWIVPGLAFGEDGSRLGYGGGWYDRLLKEAAPAAYAAGTAFPFQMLRRVPAEPHDVHLDAVFVARSIISE